MTVISSIVLQIGRKTGRYFRIRFLERKSQNGDELAHLFPEVKKSARIHLGNSKSNRMKCLDGPFQSPFPKSVWIGMVEPQALSPGICSEIKRELKTCEVSSLVSFLPFLGIFYRLRRSCKSGSCHKIPSVLRKWCRGGCNSGDFSKRCQHAFPQVQEHTDVADSKQKSYAVTQGCT